MRLPVLIGAVTLALVGAGTARALTEPQSTLLRSITPSELKAFIQSPDFVANPANNTSAPVQTGVSRMQIASGRLAALKYAGRLSVIATGAVVIWKVSDSLGVGGYIYKKITGDPMTPEADGSGCVQVMKWLPPDDGDHTGTRPTDWLLVSGPGVCAASGNYQTRVCSFATGGTCYSLWTPWSNTALSIYAAGGTSAVLTPGSCGNVSPSAAADDCVILYRTAAQMEAAVTIEPSSAAEFASPPVGATTSTGGTNDTSTLTDPELEAALDAIDPNPGTAGTSGEQATADAILDELEPGWAEGILLQPLPNETYTQYITRLQDEGWVGDATTTVLATEQPGYGPDAVVRVIATPVGGTTTVYDPLNWPSPGPTIAIDADITIRYNPDTAPEAPTTATPTPITGAPTTIPATPAVDFSPITNLDPGCKFPYGFVCYAVDFTEQFDVTADAPVFTFTLGWTGMVNGQEEGGEAPYTVDLEVMDDYMALWRGILTVVLWVGAIYLVATRMLGFKAGGDPGEAIDDVL